MKWTDNGVTSLKFTGWHDKRIKAGLNEEIPGQQTKHEVLG